MRATQNSILNYFYPVSTRHFFFFFFFEFLNLWGFQQGGRRMEEHGRHSELVPSIGWAEAGHVHVHAHSVCSRPHFYCFNCAPKRNKNRRTSLHISRTHMLLMKFLTTFQLLSDHNLLICEARPTAQDGWCGIKVNCSMSNVATIVRKTLQSQDTRVFYFIFWPCRGDTSKWWWILTLSSKGECHWGTFALKTEFSSQYVYRLEDG